MLDPSLLQVEVIPSDLGKVTLNLLNNAPYARAEQIQTLSEKEEEEYIAE